LWAVFLINAFSAICLWCKVMQSDQFVASCNKYVRFRFVSGCSWMPSYFITSICYSALSVTVIMKYLYRHLSLLQSFDLFWNFDLKQLSRHLDMNNAGSANFQKHSSCYMYLLL
jgi:hypothetical protein